MAPSTAGMLAVSGFPLVRPGDDLPGLCTSALARAGLEPGARDVVVIAQKVVSKAEGRYVDLADVRPSRRARRLARAVGKDPRLVEVILSESTRILRHGPGVLIAVHRLGFVMANAGVDQSNVEPGPAGPRVLLLPRDPDASARALRARLGERFGATPGVVVSDSFGRPWRLGTVGVAIGAAGLPALLDLCGQPDLYRRPLRATWCAFADEIAAAASLLMGQAGEGQPLVLVRGLSWEAAPSPALSLVRAEEEDLFR